MGTVSIQRKPKISRPIAATALLATTLLLAGLLSGCGTALAPPSEESSPHLQGNTGEAATIDSSIPAIVSPVPLVPSPTATVEPELYSVVAQDVPVRDLLFNLARDTAINVDVHPSLTGLVTLNAIDQSLPQILERLGRQASIRWRFDENNNLVVEPDSPYWKSYQIDYVNVSRASTTTSAITTSITARQAAGGGGGGGGGGGTNNSTSSLTQNSSNNFWTTLTANLSTLPLTP